MLRIYKLDDGNYTMVADCEVDLDSKIIHGRIVSFSKYVVMANEDGFGFVVNVSKDRIAADSEDSSTVSVWMKKLNDGDTSKPTGDPLTHKTVRVTYKEGGRKTNAYYTTDKNGFCSFIIQAPEGFSSQGYLVCKVSDFYTGLGTFVIIHIGYEWPYSEHFDEDLGTEWACYDVIIDGLDTSYIGPQPISIKTSPNGQERFLGPFTTDQVVLTLDNIPTHYRIVLEFDFIAIGPWQEGVDQCWVTIKNDPDQEMYHYCSMDVSIQEEDFTGGFDENDIINTLGYPTGTLVYTDKRGEEQELEKGDGVFHLETNMIQHRKDSIQIAFNVDERGFGEACDVGQYWGIDNIYVRYWAPETA
jgi:hypothetical protein